MKKFTKLLALTGLFATGIFLFQAQDGFPTDEDSNYDRVPWKTRLAYVVNPPAPQPLMVVTGSDGYDNFDLGVDFAEVHMSVNPTNNFGSFGAYNINNGHWSSDGNTWSFVSPPFPNTAGDPWTAYDSLGNLYYITLNSSVSGTWVLKSTNNGQTWGAAVSGCTGNDRETMAADQTNGPFTNYIYCGETPGNFARSTNGGASFTNTASLSNGLPGFMMAVGAGPTGISGGAVYVVTSNGAFQAPTYTVYRSTDGGASFTTQSTQSGWVNVVGTIVGNRNSYQNMRLRPYPFVYADNSFGPNRGRFYIFYCANNPPGDGNKPDVYVRYSTDGGVTFSSPVTINDDGGIANAQFHPAAWCDKQTGRLYCQWMDTRNTPTADSAEMFASLSTNGGVTWQVNQKISTAKYRINCPTCGGGGIPAYQGDYNSIGSVGTISLMGWTDFRAGTFGSYFAYFPDFAMRIIPSTAGMNGSNDSVFTNVSIPSVKLYTDKVRFTTAVTPPPGAGTITVSLLNRTNGTLQDTLTTYPDSLRMRVKTAGGVPNGFYTVTVTGTGRTGGTNQPPVHKRTYIVNVGFIGITQNNNEIPNKFYLYQNYPNPFNPSTKIRFDLPKNSFVKINVYDITGKVVQELVNSVFQAGSYSADFDASKYASGVYFYKIETADNVSIKKMILLK